MHRRTALTAFGVAGLFLLAPRFARLLAAEVEKSATDALGKFGAAAREYLRRLVADPGFDGRISAGDVRRIGGLEGKDAEGVMLALLPLAQTYARPPLSGFRAGAVVRGASGDVYLGANLEIAGHALGYTVHGEQAALSNAYLHGERNVESLAGSDAPCGYCRQFMYDFAPHGDLRIVIEGSAPTTLAALLPAAFGPADLGMKDGAFPIKEVDLVFAAAGTDRLAQAALLAARKSYAPYTKAYSGVAIGTRDGRVFSGTYLENAAFNPSFSPLQAALIQLILAGRDFPGITDVCLVEAEPAPISQQSATQAILGTIAPAAKLRRIAATLRG